MLPVLRVATRAAVMAVLITPANEQDRAQVEALAEQVQIP